MGITDATEFMFQAYKTEGMEGISLDNVVCPIVHDIRESVEQQMSL